MSTDQLNAMRMAGSSSLSASARMSEAVSANPFLLLLLEHLDIDLPLQEKSLGEVASENGIETDLFLTFVNLYGGMNKAADLPFTGREVPSIIRYLKNSHRYYSEEVYPGIMDTIRGISLSGNSEETRMIEKFFTEYLAEVKNHFDYEEQTVFPYIVQLNERLTGKDTETAITGYSVSEYREHHDDIEEKLDDLKSLLIEYLPLKEGRQVRRKLLFRLYELEHDLRIHSGIEDHILIPLVATIESRINKRS